MSGCGLRFWTSLLFTGCQLHAGGGQWDCTSDRNAKENFVDVDGEDVLEKLSSMPIKRYNYISEQGATHLGPMAQDFQAAFGLGTDEKSIAVLDAAGVALAGIKTLEARTSVLDARVSALEQENQMLRERLARLELLLANE
jgi:trimeric autotransporter adhesin